MKHLHTKSHPKDIQSETDDLFTQMEKINLELIHLALIKTHQYLENNHPGAEIIFFEWSNGFNCLIETKEKGPAQSAMTHGANLMAFAWNNLPNSTIKQFLTYFEGSNEFKVIFKNTKTNRLKNVARLLGNGENAQRWLQRIASYQEQELLQKEVVSLPTIKNNQTKKSKI